MVDHRAFLVWVMSPNVSKDMIESNRKLTDSTFFANFHHVGGLIDRDVTRIVHAVGNSHLNFFNKVYWDRVLVQSSFRTFYQKGSRTYRHNSPTMVGLAIHVSKILRVF